VIWVDHLEAFRCPDNRRRQGSSSTVDFDVGTLFRVFKELRRSAYWARSRAKTRSSFASRYDSYMVGGMSRKYGGHIAL